MRGFKNLVGLYFNLSFNHHLAFGIKFSYSFSFFWRTKETKRRGFTARGQFTFWQLNQKNYSFFII